MGLVTRCTACGTLFKVVADQLKISDGWVRCGQCGYVFDAQANLVDASVADSFTAKDHSSAANAHSFTPTATPTTSVSLSAPPSERLIAAAPMTPSAPHSIAFGSDSMLATGEFDSRNQHLATNRVHAPDAPEKALAASSEQDAQNVQSTQDAPKSQTNWSNSSVASSPPPASVSDPPSSSAPDSQQFQPGRLRDLVEIDSEAGSSSTVWVNSSTSMSYEHEVERTALSRSDEPTTFSSTSSSDPNSASGAGTDAIAAAHAAISTQPQSQAAAVPSFIRQAERAARWRKPWVRALLSLVTLVLLATLALQIALHDKDRIAASWPQTKPYLQLLCTHAGCQVNPPKHIEAIVIDSSSFNRIQKNNPALEAKDQSYRLNLTLKNTSIQPVAMPYFELSLQDAQDQSLIRRVLTPADFGLTAQQIDSGQDISASLVLQIPTAELAGSRIHGYRVLAFYP